VNLEWGGTVLSFTLLLVEVSGKNGHFVSSLRGDSKVVVWSRVQPIV